MVRFDGEKLQEKSNLLTEIRRPAGRTDPEGGFGPCWIELAFRSVHFKYTRLPWELCEWIVKYPPAKPDEKVRQFLWTNAGKPQNYHCSNLAGWCIINLIIQADAPLGAMRGLQ